VNPHSKPPFGDTGACLPVVRLSAAYEIAAWFKQRHFQVTPEIDRALMTKGFLVLGVTLI